MTLEVRITVNGRSYAWRSGEDLEQLDTAIQFLQEMRELFSSPLNPAKPIVTDDPDFVLTKPK